MNLSLKLLLAGIFTAITFLLSGCTTTYYGSSYGAYPSYYRSYGYRSVHHYHHSPDKPNRPGGGGSSVGRPAQLPSNPKPRPTKRR